MNTEMEQACCKYRKDLTAVAKAMAKIRQGKIRLAETTSKAEAKTLKKQYKKLSEEDRQLLSSPWKALAKTVGQGFKLTEENGKEILIIEDNNDFNDVIKKLGEDNIEEAIIEEVGSQKIQEEPTVEKLAPNCEKEVHSSKEKTNTQDEESGDEFEIAPPPIRAQVSDHISESRCLRSSGSVPTVDT